MKYGNLTPGQVEAILKKLGGQSGAEALLRDDLVIRQFLPNYLKINGYTEKDLELFEQFFNHKEFRGVLRGTHTIKAMEEFSCMVSDIDREVSQREMLEATGRTLIEHRCDAHRFGRVDKGMNDHVIQAMPKSKNFGSCVEISFFTLENQQLHSEEVEKHCADRGLVLRDLFTLIKFNQDNPEFSDTHPHLTQWRDDDGKLCRIRFFTSDNQSLIEVDRFDDGVDWSGTGLWIPGISQ